MKEEKDKYAKITSKESKKWDSGIPGRVIVGYIFCAIAAVYGAGVLVNLAIELSYGEMYWSNSIMLGVFSIALGFSILLGVRATRRKKAWKAWLKQQKETTTIAMNSVEPLMLSKLPDIPEQTKEFKLILREINGGDLFDLCKNRDAISVENKLVAPPIHVYSDTLAEDNYICVLYTLQYGQGSEDRTYAVWLFADEDGGTDTEHPCVSQLIRNEDGSTVMLFVDNDDFSAVVLGDMNARMEREMKAKGIATAGDEKQSSYSGESAKTSRSHKSSRLGRLKSRFKSNVGESKKASISAFVSVAVMYVVILVAALVLYFVRLPSDLSDQSLILIKTAALGYLLITPSFLLYFGCHNPFNFKKSISTVFIVLGIVGMVACDIYGIFTATYYSYANISVVSEFIVTKFIPIALCVSTVAYILVYLVWCRGLSSKWFASMAYVTTILFPVATALILAAIALYIAWTLLIWLISAIKIMLGGTPIERGFKKGWSGKGQSSTGYEIIDENGYTRTLTPYEGNRYRDDTGAFWVSDDGGNSFRRD